MSPEATPGPWRALCLAARPRTLPVGVAPIALGTALAAADGVAQALPAAAALATALLLQIGANLANDVQDHARGADTAARVGPARAVAQGWLAPRTVWRAALAAFAAAALLGLYLIALGGWPLAVAGALAITAGLAYTGGPYPLGYNGLGDLAVFLFFGVVAVCGSYYVQAGFLPAHAVLASLPLGALATAVLAVNNLRDLETDRVAGKRTLAVRLGPGAARTEYGLLVASAYAALPGLAALGAPAAAVWLPLVTLPFALVLVHRVWRGPAGDALNPVLAATARLELAFAVALALGVLA